MLRRCTALLWSAGCQPASNFVMRCSLGRMKVEARDRLAACAPRQKKGQLALPLDDILNQIDYGDVFFGLLLPPPCILLPTALKPAPIFLKGHAMACPTDFAPFFILSPIPPDDELEVAAYDGMMETTNTAAINDSKTDFLIECSSNLTALANCHYTCFVQPVKRN
jgi:hypothetical protein